MRLVDVKEIAFMAVGFSMAAVITTELFYNREGTITQIAAMALSTLIVATEISSAFLKSKMRILPDSFRVTLIFAVCFGISLAVVKLGAISDTAYYQTCPNYQPHFIQEADRIIDECVDTLSQEEWKADFDVGHSSNGKEWYAYDHHRHETRVMYCADGMSTNRFENKKLTSKVLCSQILFPTSVVKESNDENCRPSWHLSPEARRQITVYKRELYEITQCDPKIQDNPFFKVHGVIRAIAVLTPVAAVALLIND